MFSAIQNFMSRQSANHSVAEVSLRGVDMISHWCELQVQLSGTDPNGISIKTLPRADKVTAYILGFTAKCHQFLENTAGVKINEESLAYTALCKFFDADDDKTVTHYVRLIQSRLINKDAENLRAFIAAQDDFIVMIKGEPLAFSYLLKILMGEIK